MYEGGLSLQAIGRLVARDPSGIRQAFARCGLPTRPRGAHNAARATELSQALAVDWYARYQAGATIVEIARSVGRGTSTVLKAFRLFNLPTRGSRMAKPRDQSP